MLFGGDCLLMFGAMTHNGFSTATCYFISAAIGVMFGELVEGGDICSVSWWWVVIFTENCFGEFMGGGHRHSPLINVKTVNMQQTGKINLQYTE